MTTREQIIAAGFEHFEQFPDDYKQKLVALFEAGRVAEREECDKLRDQVTLLRDAMNRIAFSRVGTCENIALELFNREAWAIEALAATEPTSIPTDT